MTGRKLGACMAACVALATMLLMVVTPPALAGSTWIAQEDYPAAFTTIWDISCSGAVHCVVVGQTAGDIGAVDAGSGSSWTRETIPTGVSDLFGVSCPSAAVCVAVGDTFSRELGTNPTILYSTDGAKTWTTSTLPSGQGGVSDVSCFTSSDCVAGGSGVNPIEVTSDGGKVWKLQPGPTGVTQVYQVSCVPGGTTCAAVGATDTNQPMILSYSGTKWTATAYGASPNVLTGVACPSASDCIVVGNAPSAVVLTTTNGKTWTSRTLPSGVSDLAGVSCLSSSACVALGEGAPEVAGGVTGSITGGAFTVVTPPAGDDSFGPVSCVATSKDCTALAGIGSDASPTVAASTDSGAKWSNGSLPLAPFPLASVSCGAVSVCVAVGGSATAGVVESTNDGGAVWTGAAVAGVTSIASVTCSSASDCEAVGTSPTAGAQFLVTTDGGASWTVSALKSTTQGMEESTSLSCLSPSDCVALGVVFEGVPPDMTTLSTTNGGKTWTDTGTSFAGDTLTSVSCSSTSDCVLVGGNSGGAVALTTTNFGKAWTSRTLPTSPAFFLSLASVSCASTADCVAVGDAEENDVLRTSDGGSIWKEEPSDPSADDSLYAVSCRSTSDCVAVGIDNLGTAPGGIQLTTNGGSSWTSATAPSTSSKLFGVSCWSTTACVAVGNDSSSYGSIIIGSLAPVAPLKITTASLPGGTVSKAYSAKMAASGGTTPYTWKLTAGTRPPGLTVSSAGVWSGKPTKAGTYSFTMQVTDKSGTKLSKVLKIVVAK